MIVNNSNVNLLFARVNDLVKQQFTLTRLWSEFRLVRVGFIFRFVLFYFADLQPIPVPPPKIVFNFGPVTDQPIPDIVLPDEPKET